MKSDFKLEDVRWLQQKLQKFGGRTPLYVQLRKWVEAGLQQQADSDEDGATTFGIGKFGCEFDMTRQLDIVESQKSADNLICRCCYELAVEPQLTKVCLDPCS